MTMSVAELRESFLGDVYDSIQVVADPAKLLDFALACGETDPRYTDPKDPDFQAPVNFCSQFHGARMLPENFPKFDMRIMIDAGKAVQWHAPVRPGDKLTANSRLHDTYEKTGRGGAMLFLVHRMEFRNASDQLVAVVDWRLILRGGLDGKA
jgi:hypothetical protein